MKVDFWIAWRLLRSGKSWSGGSILLSFVGLILGVASLVVSMSVISGFEQTLQQSISDVTGHVVVARRGRAVEDAAELEARLRSAEPDTRAVVRFMRLEALLTKAGRVHGVIIQGVDPDGRDEVLNLSPRLLSGALDVPSDPAAPRAWIGKGLATQFGLSVGDDFRVVMPVADSVDPERFQRRVAAFRVAGVMDLGKFEWNERYVLTDLDPVVHLADVAERPQGLMLRFSSPEAARGAGFRLAQLLGPGYYVSDWREINEHLFEAIRLEKPVIFFVVFIIVVVAAFNIASTLFVNVLRRTPEFGLLRALGLSRASVLRIVSFQGLIIGALGCVLGIGVGLLLCWGFGWLQTTLGVIEGSVYKLEGIRVQIRWTDLAAVVVSTLSICVVASLAPARRAGRLSPVEGLRHG